MPIKPEPYDEGDQLTIELVFTDALDAPKDPTDVDVELRCPDGTVIAWAMGDLTHPSTGVFRRVYVVANGHGRYLVVGTGAGALPIVQKRYFTVRA